MIGFAVDFFGCVDCFPLEFFAGASTSLSPVRAFFEADAVRASAARFAFVVIASHSSSSSSLSLSSSPFCSILSSSSSSSCASAFVCDLRFSIARAMKGSLNKLSFAPSTSSSPPSSKAFNAAAFALSRRLRSVSGSLGSSSSESSASVLSSSSSVVVVRVPSIFSFNCWPMRSCSCNFSRVPARWAIPFLIARFAHLDVFL